MISLSIARYLAVVCFVLLIALALGCASAGSSGQTPPDIRGNITSIQPVGSSDVVGRILIEGTREADTQFDKASAKVTEQTRIYDQRGNERRRATFESLKVGQRAEAWFTGPVAESYPVQATALEIVILSD